MKFELNDYNRGLSDQVLLDDLRRVAAELEKDYVTKGEYNERGKLSSSAIQKRFGSWSSALKKAGLRVVRHFNIEPSECVRELKRVAQSIGKSTVTVEEFKTHGEFSPEVVVRRMGSWTNALTSAGLTASPHYHAKATEEQLFQNLEALWEKLGRQPRTPDFSPPLSAYSVDVYKRRYGSLRKALEAFVASIDQGANWKGEKPININSISSKSVPPKRRTSRSISWRLRFLVMRRDEFKCRICGRSPATHIGTVLVIDHVEPWAHGGESEENNLQTLCVECNGGKSDLPLTTKNG